MLDWLGDLLVRLVPVALPIVLIWSFLMNHGLAPDGSSKSDGEQSADSKKSKSSAGKEQSTSTDTKGPEG